MVKTKEKEENVVEATPRPPMDSPDWKDWVMSHFLPTELDNGLPKVDGLRRVTRKLIGPILEGHTKVVQYPTIENEQRATVEYTVVVQNRHQLGDHETPYEVRFTDAADAFKGNVKGLEYARFPVAMAASRAQGRALRMALNLGVVAAEEISDQPLEEAGFASSITKSQIDKIDIKCQQLNIDVLKFMNIGTQKYYNIEEVSNRTAIKMFKLLNEYQQGVKEIPTGILGYQTEWKDQ